MPPRISRKVLGGHKRELRNRDKDSSGSLIPMIQQGKADMFDSSTNFSSGQELSVCFLCRQCLLASETQAGLGDNEDGPPSFSQFQPLPLVPC